MAPKKKEQQKMSLGDFLTDTKLGSWADEMEDMPVYSRPSGYGGSSNERRTYSATTGTFGNSTGGYSVREELPLPDKPPYTVHLGNLSFDATIVDVNDFFGGCECINVRIIEDKMEMKPKGFGYAEFGSLEGLKSALALNGSQFQGRNIRISVADPPKDRGDRPDAREITDWSRKGPLPDLPGRSGERRPSDRGYQSSRFGEEGGERRPSREPESDGKVRDFGNWERKGPLSPLAQQERAPREGGRPGTTDGPRAEGFRDRKASPAAWGEGRSQGQGSGSQDGSRPPRREFQERPAVERAPTAADQDSQWRSKMRPDAPIAPAAKSPVPSREGSEAPASPALPSAPAGGRPRLNLAKRTVTEAPTDSSSPSATGDAKASPFGAARPIDTAAKEKEIEEKRQQAVKEKKDADEKAKQEREAAKAKEIEDNEKKVEILQREGEEEAAKEGETIETENANGEIVDDKAVKPKEIVRDARPKPSDTSDARPKPSDTGAWRRPSSGPKPPRDDIPRGPRGRGDGHHAPRGPRNHDGGRNYRHNANGGGQSAAAPAQAQNPAETTETTAMEEDGWSTVSKPKKNNRGGNAGQRAIAS
ncbi:putative RNA-binding protein sce3 [Sclerotinia borealis F-4128]|uniref:Putative RNA-binding protein sce3 n=1 Tax=Sclerotinia borealis (strain F-4128) TaxID=1432307 RepID=W9CRB7_SCLBF|nr:putative RNA-binding protein sce3 [Sclerotinia borealis F-4128]